MQATQVTAVVVTYNRSSLLRISIEALWAQTRKPDEIIIIDNASTDNTRNVLKEYGDAITYLRLDENTGGAGGFSAGIREALLKRAEWIWLMDDDATPHPTALEELLKVATDFGIVYGSVATSGASLSWTTTLRGPPAIQIDEISRLPAYAEVESLPFLGFLIHRQLTERIGLPDAGYFIAADDVEYCLRARQAGARIVIAGKSLIEHPRAQREVVNFLGVKVIHLNLTPWKRYYDTRNRLLIARKYYGLRLLTHAIPGSFVRLYAALRHQPRKLAQLRAWSCGMVDGLLGIKGKRHEKWNISL